MEVSVTATDFSPGKGERNRNTVGELGVGSGCSKRQVGRGVVSGDMSPGLMTRLQAEGGRPMALLCHGA